MDEKVQLGAKRPARTRVWQPFQHVFVEQTAKLCSKDADWSCISLPMLLASPAIVSHPQRFVATALASRQAMAQQLLNLLLAAIAEQTILRNVMK